MRINTYIREQDVARRQEEESGLPDEMSQARHPRTAWSLSKDSAQVPACVNGKDGGPIAGGRSMSPPRAPA